MPWSPEAKQGVYATVDPTPPRKAPRQLRLMILLDALTRELYGKVLPAMEKLDGDEPEWESLADRMDVLDDRIEAVSAQIRVRRTHPRSRS